MTFSPSPPGTGFVTHHQRLVQILQCTATVLDSGVDCPEVARVLKVYGFSKVNALGARPDSRPARALGAGGDAGAVP